MKRFQTLLSADQLSTKHVSFVQLIEFQTFLSNSTLSLIDTRNDFNPQRFTNLNFTIDENKLNETFSNYKKNNINGIGINKFLLLNESKMYLYVCIFLKIFYLFFF